MTDPLRDEIEKAMREAATHLNDGFLLTVNAAVSVALEFVKRERAEVDEKVVRVWRHRVAELEKALAKWGHAPHCCCHEEVASQECDEAINDIGRHLHPFSDPRCAPKGGSE